MTTTTRRVLTATLFGTALMNASGTASAGGFSTARFGGEQGHAASDHVTSLYYNPAGIALGKGTRIFVEGTFAYRVVDYTRDEGAIDNPGDLTPDDAIDANAGPAHLANPIAAPFIGVVSDLGVDGLGVGLGFYVPYGGSAKWDKNEAYVGNSMYPGAQDGPQRWANIEGEQRNLYLTLGAAYTSPNRSVAVGVGLNIISSDISLVRARQATGTDDVIGEGRSLLEADDLTFGLGIGAQWRATRKLRLGLSYQSKPGFGEMSLEGTLTNRFPSGESPPEDVVLLQRMPDAVRFAFVYTLDPLTRIRFAADWTRWSTYEDQCLIPAEDADLGCTFNPDGSIDAEAGGSPGVIVNLDRNWKDTFGAKLGIGRFVTRMVELNGSLAFDSNAVPDETIDPSLFDMNKLIAQAGIDYWLSSKISIEAMLGYVHYFTRTTEPRDVDPSPPSRNPDMAGEYKSMVVYALLGVGVRL